jgi:deazaflavin-dependent oxidoreductase (nitroreductase family)
MATPRSYRLGPVRRALNALMTVLLGWGVGPASTFLLSTIGHTTGRRRTTPVTLVAVDGRRWLVSPYGQVGWVHNVRAIPEVSLRRGRTTLRRQAREVDAVTAGPVLRRYVGQVPVTAPFFEAAATDPVEAFVAEASRHPVFDLTESL